MLIVDLIVDVLHDFISFLLKDKESLSVGLFDDARFFTVIAIV